MEKCRLRAQLAVMNALREFDNGRGAAIELDRLRQRWPEYGLRSSDLHDAVEHLASRGFVRVEGRAGHRLIGATEQGRAWAHSQPAWLEYSLLAPRRGQYQLHQMPEFASTRQSMERRAQGFRIH